MGTGRHSMLTSQHEEIHSAAKKTRLKSPHATKRTITHTWYMPQRPNVRRNLTVAESPHYQ